MDNLCNGKLNPHMMIRRLIISACVTGMLSCSPPMLRAASCDAIKDLKLPDTTITMSERVNSGAVVVPTLNLPLRRLPIFCRVVAVLRPTADSEINFEVWMPESRWNGRFLGVGNGGFAGSIGYQGLASDLRHGYATAGSDTGHFGQAEDASWALGHPDKIRDYGWRAVHLTTERAKAIVQAYYGSPVKKAYFDSCSDGGREALMEAQRFPDDYDGILAGAPANAWSRMHASGVDLAQVTIGDPRAYISALKLPAIERSALAACDALDGVKDGIISDPSKCHFNPEVLLCKGGDSLTCLTPPQVNSVKVYYTGGKDGHGKSIFPGLVMGDEARGWPQWVVGHGPGSGDGLQYLQNYFRYMVMDDPKWNILTANVDASFHSATDKTAADLDATSSDLSRFEARGGKLIIYHGWNDPAISPWNTVAYYKSVQQQMGARQTESFLRLYMFPGMEHCVGGPGPDSVGEIGHAAEKGSKFGLLDALQDWVEKGVPAGNVIATKYAPGPGKPKVVMTRPLCPYPMVAKYKGAGDTNVAVNFTCAKE